jgi:hypothetical protein
LPPLATDARAESVRDDLHVRVDEQLAALPEEPARACLLTYVQHWRLARESLAAGEFAYGRSWPRSDLHSTDASRPEAVARVLLKAVARPTL